MERPYRAHVLKLLDSTGVPIPTRELEFRLVEGEYDVTGRIEVRIATLKSKLAGGGGLKVR